MKIGFLGSGVWATALAQTFAQKHTVSMWIRSSQKLQELQKNLCNPRLPHSSLEKIFLTDNIDVIFNTSDLVILCIPSQAIHHFLQIQVFPKIKNSQILLSATKGIDIKTLQTPSQICSNEKFIFAVLSGPSHAEELCIKKNTFVSLGCRDSSIAKIICTELGTDFLHLYPTTEVYSLEFGGTYKNILAIIVGILHGMGEKENTIGAFLCAGFNEMLSIGKSLSCCPKELSYLSGLGDLMTTCFSTNSRNRKLGELLSTGKNLDTCLNVIGQTVEGIQATKSIYEICKQKKINQNTCSRLHNILFSKANLQEEIRSLLLELNQIYI